jgi:hypothetical protein
MRIKSVIANPILGGFSLARFDSPSEVSDQISSDPRRDIYKHPNALGEPSVSYNEAMDIYSLGTILVEIAEWRSLRSVVAQVVDVRQEKVLLDQIEKVKPFLLRDEGCGGKAKLGFRMGGIYSKVTRMCLNGTVEAGDETGVWTEEIGLDRGFQPSLLDIAVRELEKCVV